MTNPTPHGQVPEALRLAEEITNLECSSEAAAKTIAAAADELCRLHVENASLRASPTPPALSAAPEAFLSRVIALCTSRGPSPENIEAWDKYDKWIADLWRQAEAMLAASPTPPAEQPAITSESGAVYAELPEEHWLSTYTTIVWNEDSMRDFADRTHALRMEQAASSAVLKAIHEANMQLVRTGDDAFMLVPYKVATAEQAAPKAVPGEQDDHQILAITTAYEQGVGKGHQAYNSGKEIANPYSPAYRCDLAWQYGYKEGKEQAQREAKAAPQQEAQEPVAWLNPWRADQVTADYDAYGERGIPLYTAPQPAPAPLSEMPYEKRKAIQEGEQISASDAWFKARHEMLDTVDRRNVFRAGFDRGWNAALAAQGGK